MKIALDAIRQLRSESRKMLKAADALDALKKLEIPNIADGYRPKRRRMSRAVRLKMSAGQKKRWAKRRA